MTGRDDFWRSHVAADESATIDLDAIRSYLAQHPVPRLPHWEISPRRYEQYRSALERRMETEAMCPEKRDDRD